MDKYFIIATDPESLFASSSTHVIYADLGDWVLTTLANFTCRISDARKDLKFSAKDGFKEIEDVIEYINTWF